MKKEPFIIAEIAQGFEGSPKLVELYVKGAAAAGANAVKFHIFYADELALPDYRYFSLFKNLEIPFEVWANAAAGCHKRGLEMYSDVLGLKSLRKMEKIGVDGYKIHTTDINNFILLRAVGKTGKKVLLSTGGCDIPEIDRAVDILKDCDLTLMHGFQAEPTLPADNNLSKINFLKNRYPYKIGFQDHTRGGNELSIAIPMIALGAGARVLEKHLTLSRTAEIEDFISALNAEEFAKWVALVRKSVPALGKDGWRVTKKEKEYRSKVKRAVCSAKDLAAGTMIDAADIILKRTDNKNAIFDPSEVIGKMVKKTIARNNIIRKDALS
jgi:N,N'-diacetyllegionaminate synthase